jgi:hypothetical protein
VESCDDGTDKAAPGGRIGPGCEVLNVRLA